MKYDIFVYEVGILILIVALVYMSFTMKKLTEVVKEKQSIWIFPFVSAVILAVSLAAHVYASFIMLPGMEEVISRMSSDEILLNSEKLAAAKNDLMMMKDSLLQLKAFSFTCFFISSLMLLFSTAIYIRWISR